MESPHRANPSVNKSGDVLVVEFPDAPPSMWRVVGALSAGVGVSGLLMLAYAGGPGLGTMHLRSTYLSLAIAAGAASVITAAVMFVRWCVAAARRATGRRAEVGTLHHMVPAEAARVLLLNRACHDSGGFRRLRKAELLRNGPGALGAYHVWVSTNARSALAVRSFASLQGRYHRFRLLRWWDWVVFAIEFVVALAAIIVVVAGVASSLSYSGTLWRILASLGAVPAVGAPLVAVMFLMCPPGSVEIRADSIRYRKWPAPARVVPFEDAIVMVTHVRHPKFHREPVFEPVGWIVTDRCSPVGFSVRPRMGVELAHDDERDEFDEDPDFAG
jgi:hypothetical protein